MNSLLLFSVPSNNDWTGNYEYLLNIPWQTELTFLFRILIGGLLGFLIGVERSRRQKEAGMGTHFTVGLAAALFTCISFIFAPHGDAARVAAQVTSGIGFLGAGIIFFRRESLHGLTTAAIIWSTAAIGMCCGAGMFILAACGAVLTILVQLILHSKAFKKHGQRLLLIKFDSVEGVQDALKEYFGVAQFYRYKVNRVDGAFQVEAVIRPAKNYLADEITKFMEDNPSMISIERLEDL